MAHGSRASFAKRDRERTKRLKRIEKLERRMERRAQREARGDQVLDENGIPVAGSAVAAAGDAGAATENQTIVTPDAAPAAPAGEGTAAPAGPAPVPPA